ncbi:hypothetical protein SBY92_002463 [Candida maltosa Xu316]
MKTSGIKRKAVISNENARVLSTKDYTNKQQQQSNFTNKRIPLGGKNHNSNNLTLNRSQSSINTKIPIQSSSSSNNVRPPSLSKSNSSLGFTVQKEEIQQPKVFKEEPSSKKIVLDDVKDGAFLENKLGKIPFTDELHKQETEKLPPTEDLAGTVSPRTDELNECNVVDDDYISRNNVDPVKFGARKKHVDELVELHWRDPIEHIPEKTKTDKEHDGLDEAELQFFSTPNDSFEYPELKDNNNNHVFLQGDKSLELDFDDETNVGEVPIIEDHDDEIGLTTEDLNNLLG